jgi:hypothetical protein
MAKANGKTVKKPVVAKKAAAAQVRVLFLASLVEIFPPSPKRRYDRLRSAWPMCLRSQLGCAA